MQKIIGISVGTRTRSKVGAHGLADGDALAVVDAVDVIVAEDEAQIGHGSHPVRDDDGV